MNPLPRASDRMTRALGALTGLDDRLQAVVGYLTDPLGSPVPAVEDRLRLVRAVHDALPTTPDLVLVLTSLSTDRAQAVRRAAVQALEDTDLALGQGSAAEAQPAAGRQGLAALESQGLGAALRVAPLTRAAEALTHLLRREGGQEVLTHLGAERPDLMALADELRGRERALAVVPEGAPVPLPPVAPLPGPGAAPEASAEPAASAAPAADELRRALGWGPGATGTTDEPGTPGKAARQVGDADLDAFVAVAEGRADQLPASVLALGAWWVAHQVPSLGLTHLTRLFLAWGERLEWSLLASRLTWDTDPRAVQDALERGGLPPSQAQEVVTSWVLYDAGPEATWPWILQNPDLALRALGEDWFSARAVLRALTYAPSLPTVLLPALAQAAVGRSEGNRALAQRLLARTPAAAELALQALGSPQAATRRAGAAWLADLGLPGGTERLRAAWAAEGDQLVRGDILRALVAYGDDVTDIVAPEALAVPARRPRVPVALAWFPFETLPAVRLTDGTALDADAVRRWVLLAHGLKDPDGRGTVAAYLSLLDPRSARELSAVVVESWIARNRELGKGESLRTKGLLAFAVGMDGARLAADARSALRRNAAWRVESETVLTAVAANRAPEALQVVLAAAAGHRLPRVRDAARSLAEAAAAERGWSPAELGDRTVPTVGFSDDGLLHLSYGDREFLGRLTPGLTVSLSDADGRPRKTLPPPRKSEDPEVVAEARARLAAARKELRAVLDTQRRRLYEAMCAGRTWPLARWRELLATHPLLRHLVVRLVWTASGEGLVTFRPTEDGVLLGVDDAGVELADDVGVRLAHGTLLGPGQVEAWRAHLADYQVDPLFDQFSAPAVDVDAGQTTIQDGAGRRVVARDLRRAAQARGYERASTRYRYRELTKDFPDLGLRSVIDLDGADAWDEGQTTTTGALTLRRAGRPVPLDQVPPVLLAECYADYRAVVGTAPSPLP
ncbi:DUF4132 domain-containing protein [Actinomyces sp. oral taxon 897]|uniref:DUF4132 domain-containing protein n=1 Tax=Actinomyces sp. oral taxon 897 TaxID=2081702 RepID=UPI0020C3D7F1|nr:DUF4132 domain-containing protein [Actinomyces sp. oral taxon 897]